MQSVEKSLEVIKVVQKKSFVQARKERKRCGLKALPALKGSFDAEQNGLIELNAIVRYLSHKSTG